MLDIFSCCLYRMMAAAVMNLRVLFISGEATLSLGPLQGDSSMVQRREGYEYRSRGGILHVSGGRSHDMSRGFCLQEMCLMVCVLPLGFGRRPITFRGCVKLPWFRYVAGIRRSFFSAGVFCGLSPDWGGGREHTGSLATHQASRDLAITWSGGAPRPDERRSFLGCLVMGRGDQGG